MMNLFEELESSVREFEQGDTTTRSFLISEIIEFPRTFGRNAGGILSRDRLAEKIETYLNQIRPGVFVSPEWALDEDRKSSLLVLDQ